MQTTKQNTLLIIQNILLKVREVHATQVEKAPEAAAAYCTLYSVVRYGGVIEIIITR